MTTSSELVDELEFSTPPVREVTLSLFFDPILEITSSVVVPILSSWEMAYPIIEETRPDAPWDPDGRRRLSRAAANASHWPIPQFSVSSPDRSQTIRVQEDRFELVWRFDPDNEQFYVGYAHLKGELTRLFDAYVAELVNVTSIQSIEVRRADATYSNILEVSPLRYLTGLLSGWSSEGRNDLTGDYVGMRFSNFEDLKRDNVETVVSLDPILGIDACELMIDVQCQTIDGRFLEALDLAHSLVLTNFVRLTSDEMRSAWGEQ